MKQNAYTIKDAKSNTYGVPFFSVNDGTASRSFTQAAQDENTTISQFPEDYSLYKLGEFDDQSGEIKSNAPTFIMNAPVKPTISQQIEESIETHL